MAERDKAARTLHGVLKKIHAGKPVNPREADRADDALRVLIDTAPPLVGATDAGLMLGVARPNLRTLKGMPEPHQRISNGAVPVFLRHEIEAFADERGK